MAEHTPGPWLLEDGTKHRLSYGGTPQEDDWKFGYRIAAKDNCHLAQVGAIDARYKHQAAANARLIAAAPELLKFAERWLEVLTGPFCADESTLEPWCVEFAKEARAAIAKAQGE
jgi:hypothetical protein